MKAIINGVSVEGTPQELAQYQKEMDDMRREGIHIKPPLGITPKWVTGDVTVSKCPNQGNQCFCTGACTGLDGTTIVYFQG